MGMAKKVRLDLVMDSRVKQKLFVHCANRDVSVSHYIEMLVAEELGLWDLLYMRPFPMDGDKEEVCGVSGDVLCSDCPKYPACKWLSELCDLEG